MLEASRGLSSSTRQEAYQDARLYASVPYRAFKDRRLTKNDFAVLVAACGFMESGRQIGQVPQQWIAEQIGVYYTLIYRHMVRLEGFGYLVRLAPKSKRDKLCTLYGVVYDPDKPPTRRDLPKKEADVQPETPGIEQLPKKEAIGQQFATGAVQYSSRLAIVWRGLVGDYSPNELERAHWQELAALGATPEHLRQWYTPGRDLIGYYMQHARQTLVQA